MGEFEKPDKVRRAQLEGDNEALSRMGKKGAKVAAQNREIKKELHSEKEEEEMLEHYYNKLLHEYGEERAKEMIEEFKRDNS